MLAGGSDLLIALKRRLVRPERPCSIFITFALNFPISPKRAGNIRIGALTPLSTLEGDSPAPQLFPFPSPRLSAGWPRYRSGTVPPSAATSFSIPVVTTIIMPTCLESRFWETCVKKKGALCHVSNKRDGVCFSVYSGDLAALLIPMGARAA